MFIRAATNDSINQAKNKLWSDWVSTHASDEGIKEIVAGVGKDAKPPKPSSKVIASDDGNLKEYTDTKENMLAMAKLFGGLK